MTAEREALRMGIGHLTVLFPTEVSSFDLKVGNSGRTVQYKLNAQSLRLFSLHSDVNGGANRLQNITKLQKRAEVFRELSQHLQEVTDHAPAGIPAVQAVSCPLRKYIPQRSIHLLRVRVGCEEAVLQSTSRC